MASYAETTKTAKIGFWGSNNHFRSAYPTIKWLAIEANNRVLWMQFPQQNPNVKITN